ncbi:MAG: LamG domain-containing protein [Actinobacteria bacterium]|nr:LamG domain-containing protein [Actinomycetota bacterium]
MTAPMGRWFHVALIRGSDNRPTLFLDGTSVWTDATANSSAPDSGGPFRVGIQTGNTSPLNGQLDNVKVWTGALTSAQIQASMHSYGATQSSGVAVASGVTLRAHYDFNEFNQGVEPDRSGNGFDLVASAGISSASYTDSLLIESGTAHALQTFVKFNRTYLTATGGWTPPSNVNRFKALVVGGGGAGPPCGRRWSRCIALDSVNDYIPGHSCHCRFGCVGTCDSFYGSRP